jgi:hypothetical protein
MDSPRSESLLPTSHHAVDLLFLLEAHSSLDRTLRRTSETAPQRVPAGRHSKHVEALSWDLLIAKKHRGDWPGRWTDEGQDISMAAIPRLSSRLQPHET